MMNHLKFGILFFALLALSSCKKDPEPAVEENPEPTYNCPTNSGYFNIDINGDHYELVVDEETQYTNVYNWFGDEESHFVIDGKNQLGGGLSVELFIPGKFNLGSTTYLADAIDPDFFQIELDSLNLSVSNVEFNVTTSNLNINDGLYRPMEASFTGVACAYPWTSGATPADTFSISGTICLNGGIMN
jgi:hypothetical protein